MTDTQRQAKNILKYFASWERRRTILYLKRLRKVIKVYTKYGIPEIDEGELDVVITILKEIRKVYYSLYA